ncbi:response regulator transcription factor [Cognataquiflexum rubidum]|uniref:response regulator n=1 Tax=Cognataquiflexum rubidum TaxID=2922273 RepID=UPI001F1344CE|nr:response regulator transcription factor [Cognataquiflexum rubidum]MCH6235324.1 response regulator transcription factor [Cognataquiflexum rubidum]
MIRIALADDHKMFAKGIASLLEDDDDLRIEGIFSNGLALMEFLESNEVDVVLTDMNMPLLDGAGVIEAVKRLNPDLKVIVLSMYDDEAIFNKCQKLGANAYILKNADSDELIYTIKEVHEGSHIMNFQKVLSQNIDDGYTDYYKQKFKLSKRELQLVRMIKRGMTNREVAEELHLSIHTVEAHRKKVHAKLGVSSIAELVKKAFEIGI